MEKELKPGCRDQGVKKQSVIQKPHGCFCIHCWGPICSKTGIFLVGARREYFYITGEAKESICRAEGKYAEVGMQRDHTMTRWHENIGTTGSMRKSCPSADGIRYRSNMIRFATSVSIRCGRAKLMTGEITAYSGCRMDDGHLTGSSIGSRRRAGQHSMDF